MGEVTVTLTEEEAKIIRGVCDELLYFYSVTKKDNNLSLEKIFDVIESLKCKLK